MVAVGLVVAMAAAALSWSPAALAQRRSELTDPEKREILDDTLERAPRAPASPDDPFHAVHVHEQERDGPACRDAHRPEQAWLPGEESRARARRKHRGGAVVPVERGVETAHDRRSV